MERLSIVIPAYNEERRIGATLEAYSSFFEGLRNEKKLDYEILVVINGTTDRTEEIVREFCASNKRIRYLNFRQGGKGFAVIEGFKDALKRDNDLIGFVDADMATLPEDFYELVKKIRGWPGAIASRYVRGAIIDPKPTFQRLIAKRVFNMWIRAWLFLPYRDTQCGAKVFRRDIVEIFLPELKMSGWAFDVDILYCLKRKGIKLLEIPTNWSDRGYATINFWQAGPKMTLAVLRLRLLNSHFKDLVKIYDIFSNFSWRRK